MKNKGIIIAVIVLLSLWAVLATITAVDTEIIRKRLFAENSSLEQRCEDMEDTKEAYEKLKTKYDELKAEHKEDRDELRETYLKCLAYEIALDMSVSISMGEDWDFYDALYEIQIREGLDALDYVAVASYCAEITEGALTKNK